jgi:hypothetical protein
VGGGGVGGGGVGGGGGGGGGGGDDELVYNKTKFGSFVFKLLLEAFASTPVPSR